MSSRYCSVLSLLKRNKPQLGTKDVLSWIMEREGEGKGPVFQAEICLKILAWTAPLTTTMVLTS